MNKIGVVDQGLQDYIKTCRRLEAELQIRIESARFNERPERHLGELVNESSSRVKRYATEKLAGILYGCVEWIGRSSRAEIDWYFAEYLIGDFLGEEGIRGFTEKGIVLCTYETLSDDLISSISEGRILMPKSNMEVIHHPGTFLWLPYKEQLRKLPDETLIEHLNKGHQILPQNMDLFLGRSVWEIYQDAQCHYFRKGSIPANYGDIRFH